MCTVIKRNNQRVEFDNEKIRSAIKKAALAAGEDYNEAFAHYVAMKVREVAGDGIDIASIQKLVENELMESQYKETARAYIRYRWQKDRERETNSKLVRDFNEIVEIKDGNLKNDNANINGNIPAGQMMKFASIASKDHALNVLMPKKFTDAYRAGDIHPHDLDYYGTRSLTCCQIDLLKLFHGGFATNDGPIREPQKIESYASLAAIALQCNQNEMHGGQSIPNFDFAMAEGVRKSFVRNFKEVYELIYDRDCPLDDNRLFMDNQYLIRTDKELYNKVLKLTRKQTHQAMEGFIHNCCSMHSRGGGQVAFVSINYGTDTSPEGRMVIQELLNATEKGLGNGSTPIFPIQIMKMKTGITFDEEDYQLAAANIHKAVKGELTYKAPNFDLFIRGCVVSSKRLFPNFSFLDAPFNFDPLWNANDPERYKHECAVMGCRTRVYEDIHGPRTSISRGNNSFTTMNIVRASIQSKLEALDYFKVDIDKSGYEVMRKDVENLAVRQFFDRLLALCDLTAEQLYSRFEFQCKAKAKQFPFLMKQGNWVGGEALDPEESVAEVIKHGSLTLGFIGLAECLTMLIGEHHGQSDRAQQLGLRIVKAMSDKCQEYKTKYNLNFGVIGTPAEGIAGKFTDIDREEFGVIPGVTDREYYTNSNHIPVYFKINAADKIKLEAAYHPYTLGGHITYVEFDAEAKKNPLAFIKVVREMFYAGTGYGAINHPVDRCCTCSYEGVIKENEACPACGELEDIDHIERITGYLVGAKRRWNSYKLAEARDRVKHGL